MRLLLILFAVVCVHWSYAAVVPATSGQEGECPVNRFFCLIYCPTSTQKNPCANKGPDCCTSDCQCKSTQKCCQPSCGCNKVCTDVDGNVPVVNSNVPVVNSNEPVVNSNGIVVNGNGPVVNSNGPAVNSNVPVAVGLNTD